MKNRWFLPVLVSIMLMLAGCGSENKSLPRPGKLLLSPRTVLLKKMMI